MLNGGVALDDGGKLNELNSGGAFDDFSMLDVGGALDGVGALDGRGVRRRGLARQGVVIDGSGTPGGGLDGGRASRWPGHAFWRGRARRWGRANGIFRIVSGGGLF